MEHFQRPPICRRTPSTRTSGSRTGLTLLETLLATALLVVVVTAIMTAVSAGRAQSVQAQRALAATLAAEMLMARITGVDPQTFPDDIAWFQHFTEETHHGGWHGHTESPGAVRAGRATALPLLPKRYQDLSLRVKTARSTQLIPPPISVAIDGVEVAIETRPDPESPPTRLVRFLPLPHALVEGTP